jgi:hypothetical protein
MRNPYTCDNCLFNPSQYQDIGSKTGYCLKHNSLLKNSSHTTCHFFRRKDLPLFLADDGHKEHAKKFPNTDEIVFYYTNQNEQKRQYSEQHYWLTNTFDPYLHEVTLYHRSEKKWPFLQAFLHSRNPIKSIIWSSLTRRYIQKCGEQVDNYKLILSLSNALKEKVDLRIEDFRLEIECDEFDALKETYLKDITLLRIYGIQEYGAITDNEHLMWISDELNGALLSSWGEFFSSVVQLSPMINRFVIDSAQKRGTFFPEQEVA